MRRLKSVLTTDGSSDRVLVPILRWVLAQHGCAHASIEWLDPALIPDPPDLRSRVRAAMDRFPCDVLFVHRDAENASPRERVEEVRRALAGLSAPPHVCVVPVRMTEAWLLFHEPAIRAASGNPNGTVALDLPKSREVERVADPKERLVRAILDASGARGRRREKLRPRSAVHRVAEIIEDFSPLRSLAAFRALETDVAACLAAVHRGGAGA